MDEYSISHPHCQREAVFLAGAALKAVALQSHNRIALKRLLYMVS